MFNGKAGYFYTFACPNLVWSPFQDRWSSMPLISLLPQYYSVYIDHVLGWPTAIMVRDIQEEICLEATVSLSWLSFSCSHFNSSFSSPFRFLYRIVSINLEFLPLKWTMTELLWLQSVHTTTFSAIFVLSNWKTDWLDVRVNVWTQLGGWKYLWSLHGTSHLLKVVFVFWKKQMPPTGETKCRLLLWQWDW